DAKDGEWHHVAAVVNRDAGVMYLYIDGELATGGTSHSSGDSTVDISEHKGSIDVADFVLGADGENHRYGLNEAAVDQLAVYRSALSQADIADIIEDERGGIFLQREINQMLASVNQVIIGNRFTEDDVTELTEELETAKEEITSLTEEE